MIKSVKNLILSTDYKERFFGLDLSRTISDRRLCCKLVHPKEAAFLQNSFLEAKKPVLLRKHVYF